MSCDKCGLDARMYIRFDELELCDFCYYDNTKPEEKTKVDELKVYTGKDTIEALLEGKTLEKVSNKYTYKIDNGELLSKKPEDTLFYVSCLAAYKLITEEFTEVVTPQVGDWVKVVANNGKPYTGKAEKVTNKFIYADWGDSGLVNCLELKNWEILTPEQVSEYKREQVFAKVGRKLNEFRENDIVFLENTGTLCMITTKSNFNGNVGVKEINKPQKWNASVKQLEPIAFAENLVSLS